MSRFDPGQCFNGGKRYQTFRLQEELQEIIILAGLITLPEPQKVMSDVVGCKGCEGGCASALGR